MNQKYRMKKDAYYTDLKDNTTIKLREGEIIDSIPEENGITKFVTTINQGETRTFRICTDDIPDWMEPVA